MLELFSIETLKTVCFWAVCFYGIGHVVSYGLDVWDKAFSKFTLMVGIKKDFIAFLYDKYRKKNFKKARRQ